MSDTERSQVIDDLTQVRIVLRSSKTQVLTDTDREECIAIVNRAKRVLLGDFWDGDGRRYSARVPFHEPKDPTP